jgi:ERCC4-type nuclease
MDYFTIIIDTREQKPWEFPHHSIANRKLDTGDYSIEGFEDLLCIERKKGIAELANNMREKRFKDVIQRMSKYKHAYILIECNYDQMMNYPIGSDIPKKLWSRIKISPGFIMKFITDLSINHNIHVVFCGCASWAEKTALSIMKTVHKKYVSDKK